MSYFIDNMVKSELAKVSEKVHKKDKDFVMIIDGKEGSGKSVLAMQLAAHLDPNFSLDNIVFNAEDFIAKIKDTNLPKGSAIILDEAFNAANSRASLTQVNRSMLAVATEMRQRNLFIFIVLPTFFDLDKYFAIWRAQILIHVYETKGDHRYVIFPFEHKKKLYILGKKFYNYSFPKSPLPPCRFGPTYTVDEMSYRKKKANAFSKRKLNTHIDSKYKAIILANIKKRLDAGLSVRQVAAELDIPKSNIQLFKDDIMSMQVMVQSRPIVQANNNLL